MDADDRRPRGVAVIAAPGRAPLLFCGGVALIALGWRLIDITDWPSPWYPTLQYESALAARTVWLAADPRAAPPERRAWLETVGARHLVSPPLLPGLVAGVYAGVGGEVPWVARLFTTGFWLAAGAFVASAAFRLTGSRWAAAAAFAWFVLCPFGMLMSRSFQAESLLAFAFAAAVRHLAGLRGEPMWRATLGAGLVCGAAGFVKPGVLFAPLLAGFAAILLPRSVPGGPGRKLAHLAAFAVLLVLPGTLYATVLLRDHAGRLMPHLLAEAWFYRGVMANVWEAVGPAAALGAVGVVMAARAGAYLPLALLAGHFASLAVFTYHAATHDYYQVPLLVVTAVGLAWPAAWATRRVRDRTAVLIGVALVAGYLIVTPDPDIGPWRWLPEVRDELAREADRRRAEAERAEAIRAVVGTGGRVVELTAGYGYPLQYHGWVEARRWPAVRERHYLLHAGAVTGEFPTEDYFRRLTAGPWPFFVVTDREEWYRQPELRAVLARHGRPVPTAAPGLIVFALRPPGPP